MERLFKWWYHVDCIGKQGERWHLHNTTGFWHLRHRTGKLNQIQPENSTRIWVNSTKIWPNLTWLNLGEFKQNIVKYNQKMGDSARKWEIQPEYGPKRLEYISSWTLIFLCQPSTQQPGDVLANGRTQCQRVRTHKSAQEYQSISLQTLNNEHEKSLHCQKVSLVTSSESSST